VNNLNGSKNAVDALRNVWNITNELHNMLVKTKTKDVEHTEVEQLKERDYNVLQKIKTAQKRLSEMKRNVASMSQITKDIENDILDAIGMFTNEIVKKDYDKSVKVKEWWEQVTEMDESVEAKLTSTELWMRFKKENKNYIDEHPFSVDDFKGYLKNIIPTESYVEKSKKGLLEIVGFRFKPLLVQEETMVEKIEVKLELPVETKKKKIIKQSGYNETDECNNKINK
jgi:hypothetical protein